MQTPRSFRTKGMDRNADPFKVFYHQHARRVVHRAALIVGDGDADDVAQEVFFTASRAAAKGDLDISAPAWGYLRRATTFAALDHLRRVSRETPADEDKEIATVDETLRG